MADTLTLSISDVLTAYGERLVAELTDNLELGRHNASRKLSSSIRFDVKTLGSIYNFEIFMEDYWKWVDEGRRPGKQPPLKAILNWMTAKRIGSFQFGYGKNKSAGKRSITATNYQEQRRLAYSIARHIGKYGTKPTHFYSDAFKPGHAGDIDKLEEELKDATGKDLQVTIAEL